MSDENKSKGREMSVYWGLGAAGSCYDRGLIYRVVGGKGNRQLKGREALLMEEEDGEGRKGRRLRGRGGRI